LWVATESADHVWYEPATSVFHRSHIIVHELSHLIWEHRLTDDDEAIRLLFPDLDPAMVRGVLARASYSSEQEQEAETLADMIMEEAGRSHGDMAPEDPASESDLHRLEEGFG